MLIINYGEFRNEIDSLHGCINRICVTDSESELLSMYYYANIYLLNIMSYRRSQIFLKEKQED